MKYWAESHIPLKQEKGYFETTTELMEWMDGIIRDSTIHVAQMEDHFSILKVEVEKFPQLKKVFGENKKEKKTPRRKFFSHLRKAFPQPRSTTK